VIIRASAAAIIAFDVGENGICTSKLPSPMAPELLG
jgi:hypothetical protein